VLGAECDLYENSAKTPPPPRCIGVASLRGVAVFREQRFPLIDEDRGLIWGLAVADVPDTPEVTVPSSGARSARRAPRSLLISALFRIEAGRIQNIELVQRNMPLGASSGWAPTKPKKRR
jgi:hypothetical protein